MNTKRPKVSRARGNKTHGWGHKKKHRGYGNKGGRGNAGSGKRGDAKKPSFWRDPGYMGPKGFKTHRKSIRTITLRDLDKHYKEGKINLSELGYDKLLATGKITKKFEIVISLYTPRALEKIEAAGGKIIDSTPSSEKEDVAEESSQKVEA